MRVLVIGASGFIGVPLCVRLSESGAEVTRASGSGEAGEKLDIADADETKAFVSKGRFDTVVNLAGVGVTAGSARVEEMRAVNELGAANVGQAVLESDAGPHLIHVASSVEAGPGEKGESLYAETKAAGSERIEAAFKGSGGSLARVIIHNTYGPGQPSRRFISSAMSALSGGEEFLVRHPRRMRDFCYLDDVVMRLVEVSLNRVPGQVTYEIGTGIGTSLSDAAVTVASGVGADRALVLSGEDRHPSLDPYEVRIADSSGKQMLACRTGLEEGIRRTWELRR